MSERYEENEDPRESMTDSTLCYTCGKTRCNRYGRKVTYCEQYEEEENDDEEDDEEGDEDGN